MPSKDRDVEITDEAPPLSPREPREKKSRSNKTERTTPRLDRSNGDRDKDRDRDRDGKEGGRDKEREKDRDKDSTTSRPRKKSSKSSRPKLTEDGAYVSYATKRYRPRTSDDEPKKTRSLVDLVPEMLRSGERVALPYPAFSKAHSKEVVSSREDVSKLGDKKSGADPLTPDATDLGADDLVRSKSVDFGTRRKPSATRKGSSSRSRPPSPPDTNLSGEKSRDGTPSSKLKRQVSSDSSRPRSRTTESRPASRNHHDAASKVSRKSTTSSQATFLKSPPFHPPYVQSSLGEGSEQGSHSTATSVLPAVKPKEAVLPAHTARPAPIEIVDDSPESAQDSSISPKTPTNVTPQFPPPPPMFIPSHDKKQRTHQQVQFERPTPVATPFTDLSRAAGPPPPPPPPPALFMHEAPRVDYLMQNGGLPSVVPRKFLAVLPLQNGTRPSNPPLRGPETLFAPFFNLLDQYHNVLSGHGSIAVATGHRTVARRLLDRLENVFNRDLPTAGCECLMCEHSADPHHGLGWGEVLERVSGRVEIPSWPPFDMTILKAKGNEALSPEIPARPASPVKMDPDIAEEFREHYLRQSKKVKSAVDRWLNNCAEAPAPPPQEVDDETLVFAILTSLDQEDRPYFNALLSGAKEITPIVRAPTPARKSRADFVVKTGLAIQRLHRLPTAPRDAETACYLVKYPETHDLLSTINDINRQEWEILTSGRFDGFLWSGADGSNSTPALLNPNNDMDDPTTPIAGPSRGPTPATGGSSGQHTFFPPRPPPPPSLSRGPSIMSPGPAGIARHTPGVPPLLLSSSSSATPFNLPIRNISTPASFMSSTTSPGGGGGGGFAHNNSNSNYHAQNRNAVSNDEESEIAALAELEREIYLGMESLEDAFEVLHTRAETVRTALRTRGAGLHMGLQARNGTGPGAMMHDDVLGCGFGYPGGGDGGGVIGGGGGSGGGGGGMNNMDPRAPANNGGRPYWAATPTPGLGDDDTDTDADGGKDYVLDVDASESEAGDSTWGGGGADSIAPDDSASNIGVSSRTRRPRRRDERRTPAPIQEEDEG